MSSSPTGREGLGGAKLFNAQNLRVHRVLGGLAAKTFHRSRRARFSAHPAKQTVKKGAQLAGCNLNGSAQ